MTPTARVTLNGKDVTAKWEAAGLESISVTDEAGGRADTCEIAFDNRAGYAAPPRGSELKVWIGYEPTPVYMGSYKIDSWTKTWSPKRLSISAKAADLTGAIKVPRLRSHHQTTIGAIANKIAAAHGLTAVVDSRIGSRAVEHIDQQHESDMAFLSRLSRRNGATFKLADGKILIAAKGSKTAPSGKAKKAITIDCVGIISATATCSQRGDYDSASTTYMNHVAGKRKSAITGTGIKRHRDRRLYGSQAEAKAAAAANLGNLTRGQTTVQIEVVGDPTLFAEALATLKNFDKDVDGQYLVKSVTHTYGQGGYTSSIAVEIEGGGVGSADTEPADSE